MSKVQPEYLVKVKIELPEAPLGDKWHNPEEVSAQRVPEGMRLLTEKEVRFNKRSIEHGEAQKLEFYRYYDRGDKTLRGNWQGNELTYTYFTDAPYPIWEKPEFLGSQLEKDKFYGGDRTGGYRALIMDSGYCSELYTTHCLTYGFSTGNYYESRATLEQIREKFRIYEFNTFSELASWLAEGK